MVSEEGVPLSGKRLLHFDLFLGEFLGAKVNLATGGSSPGTAIKKSIFLTLNKGKLTIRSSHTIGNHLLSLVVHKAGEFLTGIGIDQAGLRDNNHHTLGSGQAVQFLYL